MSTDAPVFCVNHPQTETLLRCNKCGKPVCIKCVERTPVGYRCKECLNIQQAGYYTATPFDYAVAARQYAAQERPGGRRGGRSFLVPVHVRPYYTRLPDDQHSPPYKIYLGADLRSRISASKAIFCYC